MPGAIGNQANYQMLIPRQNTVIALALTSQSQQPMSKGAIIYLGPIKAANRGYKSKIILRSMFKKSRKM